LHSYKGIGDVRANAALEACIVIKNTLSSLLCARACGGMQKAFFAIISVVRVGSDEMTDQEKLKKLSKEDLEKTFPEWWTLAGYLSKDIRDSAIGLAVTLAGLLIELGVPVTI